jgi:hypothetical protein
MDNRHTIKRGIASIVILASVLGVGVAPAIAGQAVGRCPDGFTMVSAGRYGDEGRAIDKNGDGKVCETPLPGVGNEGSFNVIDNNAA